MLRADYKLTISEVQLLSSRDALAAFFAKIGCDTNALLQQNPVAMRLTTNSLKETSQHIERLASQDGGFFEIL
jgi:hypothetical protein